MLCALIVFAPSPAWAHTRLLRSEPDSGSRVASPRFIRLWFSERIEFRFTAITLRDQQGKTFPVLGPDAEAGDPLKISFPIVNALPPGKYSVEWRTVSTDGHPAHGRFSFTVIGATSTTSGPPATGGSQSPAASTTPQSAQNEASASSFGNSLSRAVSFAGILLVVGVIVFNLLVVARSNRIAADSALRMESRAAVVGVSASMLTIISAFARVLFETRMMRAMPGMEMTTMPSVMNSAWGQAIGLQIVAAAVALIGFSIAIRRARGAWLVVSLAGVVLAATPALSGHAAAASHLSALLIITDFLHVLGASSWLGSLACVVFIGIPILVRAGGEDWWQSVAMLVNTFSPVALASATIVVLSGVIAAWVHLEHISSLWSTAYGKVLLLKLALVLVTILIGAYNFRRVQPALVHEEGTARLRRSTAMELTTGALIIIVTGFLTGIAP